MGQKLAIIAPAGLAGYSIVKTHIEGLLPGRTVVVVGSAEPAWRFDGPTLILDGLNRGMNLPQKARSAMELAAARDFLAEESVNVVLSESLEFSMRFVRIGKALRVPFYVHAHGYDLPSRWRDRLLQGGSRALKSVNGIIVASAAVKEFLTEAGLDSSKIHVIPLGIDAPLDPHQLRGVGTTCVAASSLSSPRTPIVTLDAFRRACEAEPRLTLDYVGHGPQADAMHQFIRVFQLGEKIHLRGDLDYDSTLQLMDRADIFLHSAMDGHATGDMEVVSLPVMTAMSRGLPVISTDHGRLADFVESGVNGYLVPVEDSGVMAGRIVQLANDYELRRRMGLASLARARQLFSLQSERESLLSVLGVNSP